MNVATIALLRLGYERVALKLLFIVLFPATLFIAFASAPMTAMTYVPVYAVLWAAFLIPTGHDKAGSLWRFSAIAFALLILGLIGVPSYLSATAVVSARNGSTLPIFHQGWQLLSFAFWWEAISSFTNRYVCEPWWQLMCPTSFLGWFEMAALTGGAFLFVSGTGAKRRYGLVVVITARRVALLRALEHAVSPWPTARDQYTLSDVGAFSARAASGGCSWQHGHASDRDTAGRRQVLAAGRGELPHRCIRNFRMGTLDWALSATPPWTRPARTSSDRAHRGPERADHRIPPPTHRLETGRPVSRLCRHGL
jgi:hypothetical protein